MPFSTINGRNVPIKLWAPSSEVDSKVIAQLKNVARPWVAHHVAVMADARGRGATVTWSSPCAAPSRPPPWGPTSFSRHGGRPHEPARPGSSPTICGRLHGIERAIPVGMDAHDAAAWEGTTDEPRAEGAAMMEGFPRPAAAPKGLAQRVAHQAGTLGGGNHFIEVCVASDDVVWLMLHSGSRHIGKLLADHHIEIAQRLGHNQALVDRDLAVFPSGHEGLRCLPSRSVLAQEYALQSARHAAPPRRGRAQVLAARDARRADRVPHHNYVAEEHHFGEDVIVTRKGAIRAGRGELGIIPGSMGTKSFIVRGLGNVGCPSSRRGRTARAVE